MSVHPTQEKIPEVQPKETANRSSKAFFGVTWTRKVVPLAEIVHILNVHDNIGRGQLAILIITDLDKESCESCRDCTYF